eukprot:2572968-Prymnesium_polylepis.1
MKGRARAIWCAQTSPPHLVACVRSSGVGRLASGPRLPNRKEKSCRRGSFRLPLGPRVREPIRRVVRDLMPR